MTKSGLLLLSFLGSLSLLLHSSLSADVVKESTVFSAHPVHSNILVGTSTGLTLYLINKQEKVDLEGSDQVQHIDCFQNVCLAADPAGVTAWDISDSGSVSKINSFKLHSSNSSFSSIRVSILENTDYFLMATSGKFGVIRWDLQDTGKFFRIIIPEIWTGDSAMDVLAVPHSTYGFVSFNKTKRLDCFDTAMGTYVYKLDTKQTAMGLVSYTFDPSNFILGFGEGGTFNIMNYVSATIVNQLVISADSSEYVVAAFVPGQSLYTFLTTNKKFYFKDLYYPSVKGFEFETDLGDFNHFFMSEVTGTWFSVGNNLNILVTNFVTTLDNCHPSCHQCTKPHTRFKCLSCMQGYSLKEDSICEPSVQARPLDTFFGPNTHRVSKVKPLFSIIFYSIFGFFLGTFLILNILYHLKLKKIRKAQEPDNDEPDKEKEEDKKKEENDKEDKKEDEENSEEESEEDGSDDDKKTQKTSNKKSKAPQKKKVTRKIKKTDVAKAKK